MVDLLKIFVYVLIFKLKSIIICLDYSVIIFFKEIEMKVNINLDLKVIATVVVTALAASLALKVNVTKAQSTSTISGNTYACMSNRNFGGFVKSNTGENKSTNVNALWVVTLDPSGVAYGSYVVNYNKNFEENDAATTTTLTNMTLANSTMTYALVPSSSPYLYKLTDSSDPQNGIDYFAVANGGNTLFGIESPTTTQPNNTVCQKV